MAFSVRTGTGLALMLIAFTATISSGISFPLGKRLYRSLPSVSDNHYSEVSPDGTYKYAYTGQDSYTAERRLPDGTVEGETVYVRPDGIPVKVHYFADANGYRPKTDILYSERLVKGRNAVKQKVIVPQVVYKEVEADSLGVPPEPSVLLAPPTRGSNVNVVNENVYVRDPHQGTEINLENSNGADVAVAEPSVVAVVGPGGHAELTPEAISKAAGSKRLRAGGNRVGGKSLAKPSVIAIIGPAGTVKAAPRATSLSGTDPLDDYLINAHNNNPQPVNEELRRRPLSSRNPIVEELRPIIRPLIKEQIPVSYSTPEIDAIKAQGALIISPKASYSYEYAYSSPDTKHPSYGLNTAYVNVKVNQ